MSSPLLFCSTPKARLLGPSSRCANILLARYKPEVKLRFITEELGFESDAEACQFIVDNNGQDLLQQKDDHIYFLTGKAGPLFESSRAQAFRKVDIKGQI